MTAKLSEVSLQSYIAEKLEELGWRVEEWGRGVKGNRAKDQCSNKQGLVGEEKQA